MLPHLQLQEVFCSLWMKHSASSWLTGFLEFCTIHPELTVINVINVWMLERSFICSSTYLFVKGEVLNEALAPNVVCKSPWFNFWWDSSSFVIGQVLWKWKCGFFWTDSHFQLSISTAELWQIEEKVISFPCSDVSKGGMKPGADESNLELNYRHENLLSVWCSCRGGRGLCEYQVFVHRCKDLSQRKFKIQWICIIFT